MAFGARITGSSRLALAARVVELNRDLRAKTLTLRNDARESVALLIVPQTQTVVGDTAVGARGRLNDDKADAAHGTGRCSA